MKTFRVHFKSKAGDQYVMLDARNRAEAEALALAHQARRAQRHDVTFGRIAQTMQSGELHPMIAVDPRRVPPKEFVKAWGKRELERRKRDFSRYDVAITDEAGNTTIGAADAPLKVVSVEEVK